MFSKRLKQLRAKNKVSQAELARKLGMSQQAIAKWETEKATPDPEMITKIADYFNITTDYLLGREEKQSSSKTELSKRVKKEITEELKKFEESLMNADGLMLDGEIVSEETVQNLLSAMKIGMEIARQKNKEKFTPKKYRK
ncbi:MAG: helix-turn-helix domain-containing protein [bacterium]